MLRWLRGILRRGGVGGRHRCFGRVAIPRDDRQCQGDSPDDSAFMGSNPPRAAEIPADLRHVRLTVTVCTQPLHLARKCIRMEAMQLFDRITWNPNQMNGQPCIRGMRLTVRRVVEAVAIYPNRDDLFRNYPDLEPEDVRQALAFAAASLEDSATESSAA